MQIELKNYDLTSSISTKLVDILALINNEEETIINFENKDYYFTEDDSIKEVLYITNTCSEKEMASPLRKIGILLRNLKNITLNGNGARLWYNGRMTEFVIDNCENITIKNFVVDFVNPSVAEFEIIKKTPFSITIKVAPDTQYSILNNKFKFACENGGSYVLQERDEKTNYTKRLPKFSWSTKFFGNQLKAKVLEDKTIKITIPFCSLSTNKRYQLCYCLRDGAGTFITRSKNVNILNNTYHFMHGMGIISQLTENINIENCKIIPNYSRGRTTATFADMIHCNMCMGLVTVKNCTFDGSRDDILNVHGNHYIVKSILENVLELEFSHPQTYGFLGFDKNDVIEFINPKTLTLTEQNIVAKARMLSPRITEISLAKAPSSAIAVGYALENTTKTCAVLYENNTAKHIPTRGLLLSTQKSVIVRNNIFENMYMTNILISDDAKNWFESGYVRDVLIENNKFINCATYSIDILPEAVSINEKPPVHKNIRILNNEFILSNPKVMRIKRTENVVFKGNKIICKEKPIFDVMDCVNINIEKN